jgi:hypothetical protein
MRSGVRVERVSAALQAVGDPAGQCTQRRPGDRLGVRVNRAAPARDDERDEPAEVLALQRPPDAGDGRRPRGQRACKTPGTSVGSGKLGVFGLFGVVLEAPVEQDVGGSSPPIGSHVNYAERES